jgi:hypothetical protein
VWELKGFSGGKRLKIIYEIEVLFFHHLSYVSQGLQKGGSAKHSLESTRSNLKAVESFSKFNDVHSVQLMFAKAFISVHKLQ